MPRISVANPCFFLGCFIVTSWVFHIYTVATLPGMLKLWFCLKGHYSKRLQSEIKRIISDCH